jgi:glycogen(starch) synthase
LTEEMEHLGTQDYMGAKSWRGINDDDDENHYPFPLVRSLLLSSFPFPLNTSSSHPSFSPFPPFPRLLPKPPHTTLLASLGDSETEADKQVMKPRNRSDSLASAISGTATPSGGRKLSEKDLEKADAALSSMHLNGNGH